MSKHTGNRPAAPGKGGSLLAGILIGMIIGVTIAAGLAWFIMKSPSPFLQKEPLAAKPPVAPAQPAQPAGDASGDKPRFEFYKVLTDKPDAPPAAKLPDQPQPERKPVADSSPHYLQAGSFSNLDDADRLKARLALQGFEAEVLTVEIPEKGTWHRVRLGPYKNAAEIDEARAALKQNGIDATPTRAQ